MIRTLHWQEKMIFVIFFLSVSYLCVCNFHWKNSNQISSICSIGSKQKQIYAACQSVYFDTKPYIIPN